MEKKATGAVDLKEMEALAAAPGQVNEVVAETGPSTAVSPLQDVPE